MTVLTRLVAAAALLSVALVSPVEGSAAQHYDLAHRAHAGSEGHAGRAAAISERQNEILEGRDDSKNEKRCKRKVQTTTTTTHHPTSSNHPTPHPTTSHVPLPVKEAAPVKEVAPKVQAKPKPAPPKPAPAAPKPPKTHNSGKTLRGLSWSSPGQNLHNFKSSKIDVMYNWGASCPPEAKELGIECVSMLWGYKNIEAFEQNKNSHYYLAGMNECVFAFLPFFC